MSLFTTTASRERFVDDVLGYLKYPYTTEAGEQVQGQAFSALLSDLRRTIPGARGWGQRRGGWRFSGGESAVEDALTEAGFRIVRARTARGTPARVVTI